jgi:hypothetical protein
MVITIKPYKTISGSSDIHSTFTNNKAKNYLSVKERFDVYVLTANTIINIDVKHVTVHMHTTIYVYICVPLTF